MAAVTHAANANAVVTTGWGSPTNGYADDAAYATATPAKNSTVNSDFGFANFTSGEIADGSIIDSVTMSMKSKNATTVTLKTHGVQGYNSGSTSGSEATATGNTTEATITATLSGVTLADLRSASTLLKARVRSTQGSSSTTSLSSLNYVSMTVNYTTTTPISGTDSGAGADATARVGLYGADSGTSSP
jgi:hypothetical protein